MGQLGALALVGPIELTVETARKLLAVVVVVAISLAVSRCVTRFLRTMQGSSSGGGFSIVVNISRAIIAVLTAYYIGETVFGVHLDGIVQALGLTTLVVSLGLQDLIKNLVSGVEIAGSHLVSVGDHIEIGGVRGEVTDVNWRQTTIRDKNGNHHVIPNASLTGGTFTHLQGKMARRYTLDCEVKPGLDLQRVAADIEQLADEALDREALRAPEHTEVCYLGSTANGVQASIRLYLRDIEYTTKAMDVVMRAIGQRGYLSDWTNKTSAQEQWY